MGRPAGAQPRWPAASSTTCPAPASRLRLPGKHDPDWWVKGLIEREKITGVAAAGPRLRKEDAELDGELDRMATEDEVREALADFNRRVVEARRQLQGGPPVVTPLRDVEDEVNAWRSAARNGVQSCARPSCAHRPRPRPVVGGADAATTTGRASRLAVVSGGRCVRWPGA